MLSLPAFSRISHLARSLRLPAARVQKDLTIKRKKKIYATQGGQWLDFPKVNDVIIPFPIAEAYVKRIRPDSQPVLLSRDDIVEAARQSLQASSEAPPLPVMVLLGHFNHGKTSLLDALAGTRFVKGEGEVAITQSIRTREVMLAAPSSAAAAIPPANSPTQLKQQTRSITAAATLVDTPGQDIFFRMRNYGAGVADVAVLVVSAAPGAGFSEPQTEESIGIAESLGIPIVVVLNKIDLLRNLPSDQTVTGGRDLSASQATCTVEVAEERGMAKSKEKRTDKSAAYAAASLIDSNPALAALCKQGRQFAALAEAPFVPISATTGENVDLLRRVLADVSRSTGSGSGSGSGSGGGSGSGSGSGSGESSSASIAADKAPPLGKRSDIIASSALVTAIGTALDTYTMPGQGLTLQTVLQAGVVRPGDLWASGGWVGRVRSIRPEMAALGDVSTTGFSGGGGGGQKSRSSKPKTKAQKERDNNLLRVHLDQREVPQAIAGQGCRLLVRTFAESAAPRPLGDVIVFFGGKEGGGGGGGGKGNLGDDTKDVALQFADEEAMRDAYESYIVPQAEALRRGLASLADEKAVSMYADEEGDSAEEDGEETGDMRAGEEEIGEETDYDDDDDDEHRDDSRRSVLVKAASDAVIGTINDTWAELQQSGKFQTRLIYCGVGDVNRRDVAIAQDARATIVMIGVRLQADAVNTSITGGGFMKKSTQSVEGVPLISVKRVSDVIDMLRCE